MKRLHRRRLLLLLSVLGPGIVSGLAGNDAGGIITYSMTGAQFGFKLLWALCFIMVPFVLVMEMCARMGVVTGKGLADLIREEFGVGWTLFAMGVLLLANAFTTVAEFAGIGGGLELFGISRLISVPMAAVLVWYLVVRGTYRTIEKVLLGFCVAYLSYVVVLFISPPNWKEVLQATFIPQFSGSFKYWENLIGLVGTTISPYLPFLVQAMVVDKGITKKEYPLEKFDVIIGVLISVAVAYVIVVSTGHILHTAGVTEIVYPEDAAKALEPLAGANAKYLFGIGLLGASLLAAVIMPLSTSYAICGAMGWERSVNKSFKEAPVFFGLQALLIGFGAFLVLLPGISLVKVIYFSQVLSGFLIPVILIFILKLANNPMIMGTHCNSKWNNFICWLLIAGQLIVGIVTLVSVFIT